MPALRELQADVLRAVLGRTNRAAEHVAGAGIDAQRRLGIYRNNFRQGLTEALAAVYPTIVRLVGREFFGHAAREYIAAHPPATGNVHDYGDRMAAFLVSFGPVASLPYLPDVARLEWAWHEAFHAVAEPAGDAEHALRRIAQMPPAQQASLVLRWQPAARRVASPYPVFAIWRANLQDDPPEVRLDAGGEQMLVVQRDGDVVVEPIGPAEHALLHALGMGQPLGDALAAALEVETSFDASAAVARHLLVGTVALPVASAFGSRGSA
jgi:hypothetical protein